MPLLSSAPAGRRTPAVRREVGRSIVALDQGWTMGTELLSGILVLSGLGWLADRALGTTPWLFAIGALAGFAAGLYLVWLRAQRMDAREQAVRAGDGG